MSTALASLNTRNPVIDLWFHSKHCEKRLDSNGNIINEKVESVVYRPRYAYRQVVGISVSHVKIPVNWSRLPKSITKAVDSLGNPVTDSRIIIEEGPTGGPYTTTDLLIHLPNVNNTGIDVTQRSRGALTNKMVESLFNNTFQTPYGLTTVFNEYLGMFTFQTTVAGREFRFQDTKAARELMGIRNFTIYTPTLSPGSQLTPGQATVNDNPPTLYLHINTNINCEQKNSRPNIIYAVDCGLQGELYRGNLTADQTGNLVSTQGVYMDRDRTTTAVQLDSKERTIDSLQLEWRLESGELADLNGSEWECRLQFITADPRMDNSIGPSFF